MPKPYSQDLRERIVGAVEAGASCHEAAAAFEVGVSSAIRWVARFRRTGSAAAKPMGGKRSPLDAHKDWLLELMAGEPDLTLEEIRAKLRARGIGASTSMVWRFYARHDITFKKSLHASEQDRADARTACENWKREQPRLDPAKLIFIDETGTSLGNISQREIFAVAVLDAIGGPLPGYKSGANLYDIHISWGFLSSRFFMIFRPI